MTAATTSPLQLQPRQRAWEHIPPGAEIRVEQGSVCLHQRLYLAHDWARMPVVLHAGESYRVSGGGWMEIEALDVARLVVAARSWRAWPAALARWLLWSRRLVA